MAFRKLFKSHFPEIFGNTSSYSSQFNEEIELHPIQPAPLVHRFDQYVLLPQDVAKPIPIPTDTARQNAYTVDFLSPHQVPNSSSPLLPSLSTHSSSLTPSSDPSFLTYGNSFPMSPTNADLLTSRGSLPTNIDPCSMDNEIEDGVFRLELAAFTEKGMQHQYPGTQFHSSDNQAPTALLQLSDQDFAGSQWAILLQDPHQQPHMDGQQPGDEQEQSEELYRLEQLLECQQPQGVQAPKMFQGNVHLQFLQPFQVIQPTESNQPSQMFQPLQTIQGLQYVQPLQNIDGFQPTQGFHQQPLIQSQHQADETLHQSQINLIEQEVPLFFHDQSPDFLESGSTSPPQITDSMQPRTGRKRSRNALSLQEKAEILDFIRQDPSVSVQELSRIFGVPRSTIYGIIDNRKGITEHAKRKPGMSRVVENPFRILEALLIDWNRAQVNRGIAVTNRKLCAQAFEIHRMLSNLLSEPLPQCLFSTGWLKTVKKRHHSIFGPVLVDQEPLQSDQINEVLVKLYGFDKNDIFTCDTTNMYLGIIPESLYNDCKSSHRTDSSSISTLLCCNASGSYMVEPVILVRRPLEVVGLRTYDETIFNPVLEDITSETAIRWLEKFDRNIRRRVILLVDQDMWDLLKKSLGNLLLQFVTVLCIPRIAALFLPMRARIIGNFKAQYYTLLLKDLQKYLVLLESQTSTSNLTQTDTERNILKSSPPPSDDLERQLRNVRDAWSQVPVGVVAKDFENFMDAAADIAQGKKAKNNPSKEGISKSEDNLVKMLECVYQGLPRTIRQYYLTLKREIGPCSFLRQRILAMRNHDDYKSDFGDTLDFGSVWIWEQETEE